MHAVRFLVPSQHPVRDVVQAIHRASQVVARVIEKPHALARSRGRPQHDESVQHERVVDVDEEGDFHVERHHAEVQLLKLLCKGRVPDARMSIVLCGVNNKKPVNMRTNAQD